jgi:hypothetical protein
MNSTKLALMPVELPEQRQAARSLDAEYLGWVVDLALKQYGLSFDIEAMVHSDIDDSSRFYPPTGRFYLVERAGAYAGIGCLKRLGDGIGEIRGMYIQFHISWRGRRLCAAGPSIAIVQYSWKLI